MRIIPTKTHGLMDYLSGLLLIVLPFLLDWMMPLALPLLVAGAIIIVYSAATDYEAGIWPAIGLRFHLMLDGAMGVGLLAMPFVFHSVVALWPLVALGGILIALAVATELAETGKRGAVRHTLRPAYVLAPVHVAPRRAFRVRHDHSE